MGNQGEVREVHSLKRTEAALLIKCNCGQCKHKWNAMFESIIENFKNQMPLVVKTPVPAQTEDDGA